MPEDDHIRFFRRQRLLDSLRELVRPIDDVSEVEAGPVQLDACLAPSFPALEVVDVSSYCRHRSDTSQDPENLLAADVPGVENVIDACERFRNARVDAAVCVGDDSNAHN